MLGFLAVVKEAVGIFLASLRVLLICIFFCCWKVLRDSSGIIEDSLDF